MAKKVGITVEVDAKGALKGFRSIGKDGKKAIDGVSKSAKSATKSVKAFGSSIFSLKGLLVGLGVGLAVNKLKDFTIAQAELQDNAIKMSRALGVSVETLTSFRRSAELGGASSQVLDNAMRKLTRNLLDVQKGLGEARESFDELGISVENADGTLRNADEVLLDISDSFAKMENGSRKSATAQLLFGRAGAQLINTLNGGSDAFRRQREEAEKLGLIFSRESAKDAEVFNDTLLDLKKTAEAGFRELTNTLLPILTPLMQDLTDTIVEGKDGFKDIGKAIGQTLGIIKDVAGPFKIFVNSWILWSDRLSSDSDDIAKVSKEWDSLQVNVISSEKALLAFKRAKKGALEGDAQTEYLTTLREMEIALEDIRKKQAPLKEILDKNFAKEEKQALIRNKRLVAEEKDKETRVAQALVVTNKRNKDILDRAKENADALQVIEDRKQATITSIIEDAREQRMLSGLEGLALANELVDLEVQHKIESLEKIGASEVQLSTLRSDLEAKSTKDKQDNAKRQKDIDDSLTQAKISNTLNGLAVANNALKGIFGENKAMAIADIGISTARGIQRSFADFPFPVALGLSTLIGASGIAQASKVSSQKFADGTEFVQGAGTNRSDSVPAMLSVGERVIDQATNSQLSGVSNDEILSAVNGGGGGSTKLIVINPMGLFDDDLVAQQVTNYMAIAEDRGFTPQG